MAAILLASVINITVSFLGYKWFVFKTKGNYLREWWRCLLVYSGGIALGLVLLPPAVFIVSYVTGNPRAAPLYRGRSTDGHPSSPELSRPQEVLVQERSR